MKTATVLLFMTARLCFAGAIHDDCQQDSSSLNRLFLAGYTSGVLDMLSDQQINGQRVYVFPKGVSYEDAFEDICRVVENHPELWDKPSREAIQSAADILWKDESQIPRKTMK
jgi:hypothetical protein